MKKKYTKPELIVVDLRPDEAIFTACKQIAHMNCGFDASGS